MGKIVYEMRGSIRAGYILRLVFCKVSNLGKVSKDTIEIRYNTREHKSILIRYNDRVYSKSEVDILYKYIVNNLKYLENKVRVKVKLSRGAFLREYITVDCGKVYGDTPKSLNDIVEAKVDKASKEFCDVMKEIQYALGDEQIDKLGIDLVGIAKEKLGDYAKVVEGEDIFLGVVDRDESSADECNLGSADIDKVMKLMKLRLDSLGDSICGEFDGGSTCDLGEDIDVDDLDSECKFNLDIEGKADNYNKENEHSALEDVNRCSDSAHSILVVLDGTLKTDLKAINAIVDSIKDSNTEIYLTSMYCNTCDECCYDDIKSSIVKQVRKIRKETNKDIKFIGLNYTDGIVNQLMSDYRCRGASDILGKYGSIVYNQLENIMKQLALLIHCIKVCKEYNIKDLRFSTVTASIIEVELRDTLYRHITDMFGIVMDRENLEHRLLGLKESDIEALGYNVVCGNVNDISYYTKYIADNVMDKLGEFIG